MKKRNNNLIKFKTALFIAAILTLGVAIDAHAQAPVPANPNTPNTPDSRRSPTAIRRGATNPANNNNAKTPVSKGVNQNPSGTAPAIPFDKSPNGLNFQDAAADLLIMDYAMRTGRLVVKDPATPTPLITLRSTPESPLTDEEYLLAIESVLNLNGIALEKDGEKFLKVFPSSEFHRRGIKGDIVSDVTKKEALLPEDGRFVTRTIRLNYISIEEAKAIVEGFVRTGSQIQTFERDNSFRITDSVENVNRIIEMFSHLDKPIPALEETNIIKIQYAKATEIKERLMEIVTDAQEDQEKNKSAATERTSGAPGTYHRPLPPGAGVPGNRWNRNQPNQQQDNKAAGNAAIDAAVADAQRGLIRGKVSIFADERTNILIIITRKENMVFFNKLIEELDIATAPDVLAEVIRLEHAVAEEVAELLNELIDNANNTKNNININIDYENKKNIVIDYGGANACKALHIGHMRSANIGEALKRLATAFGHDVIGDWHLGDLGRQAGMLITELKLMQPELPWFDDNYQGEYPKLELTIEDYESKIINLIDIFGKERIVEKIKSGKIVFEKIE